MIEILVCCITTFEDVPSESRDGGGFASGIEDGGADGGMIPEF